MLSNTDLDLLNSINMEFSQSYYKSKPNIHRAPSVLVNDALENELERAIQNADFNIERNDNEYGNHIHNSSLLKYSGETFVWNQIWLI